MHEYPIENYGLIGNMHTAALVGMHGGIDWFCPQRFDAPSLFAHLLDAEKGGTFLIRPQTDYSTQKQFYWPDTNVLVTRFLCEEGVAEIIDYMPVGLPYEQMRERWLIRRVKMIRGSLPMRMHCKPAFNYGRDTHKTEITKNGVIFRAGTAIALNSPLQLEREDSYVSAEFTIDEGDTLIFSLQLLDENAEDCLPALTPEEEREYFDRTVAYWRDWIAQCTYTGRWQEIVYRSALMMKLLTYVPTGAIVAAPTTSLPERIGGERNWDYRYTWLRDAAFTVYGFIRIGFTEEARTFSRWIQERMRELNEGDALQIMYTIDGERQIEEYTLDHLTGYQGSGPIRIGNAAYDQLQLDIYGELMDALYLYNKYVEPVDYDLWLHIRQVLDWVCDNWQRKDRGPWEIRGEDRDFVYSKVMLWVALDRGIRLADKRSLPAPAERWRKTRDTIYLEIIERGWNEEIQAFTQYYDGETLDASNLIMPLVFFMSPRDPLILRTIEAIKQSPNKGGLVSDSLVYRYNPNDGFDGVEGDEGTFNMCTFWLVEALTRSGQLDEARRIFEQMLSYANHLGLYAEETGMRGEALGNFPQAFTHMSLISAAYNLNRALESQG